MNFDVGSGKYTDVYSSCSQAVQRLLATTHSEMECAMEIEITLRFLFHTFHDRDAISSRQQFSANRTSLLAENPTGIAVVLI